VQHAGRIRRQLQAGADFPELRRLLDDVDGAAGPGERERGGEAADAAADDEQGNPGQTRQRM
jgi:hypothetical protein